MGNPLENVGRYRLASFLASPDSEAFAEQIAAEWKASEEFRDFCREVPEGHRRFGEKMSEAFRKWLGRRLRETSAATG